MTPEKEDEIAGCVVVGSLGMMLGVAFVLVCLVVKDLL